MAEKKCIGCDTPIPYGSDKCPMCGAPIKTPAIIIEKIPAEKTPEHRRSSPEEPQSPRKKCHKCAMMIPKEARICPHCRKPQGWTLPAKIVAVILGFGFLSAIFGGHGTKENSPAPPPDPRTVAEKKKEDERATRALAGAMQLKKNMRNPDSFKVSSVIAMDDGAVCYEYRAENGFGGMNAERAVLLKNNNFKISSMDDFPEYWNKKCAGKSGEDLLAFVELALK